MPRFLACLPVPPKDPTIAVMASDVIETRWQHQGAAGGPWRVDVSGGGEAALAYCKQMVGQDRCEVLVDGTIRIQCQDRRQAGLLRDRVTQTAVTRSIPMAAVCEPAHQSKAIMRDATRGDIPAGVTKHPIYGTALRLDPGQQAAVFAVETPNGTGLLVLPVAAGAEPSAELLKDLQLG